MHRSGGTCDSASTLGYNQTPAHSMLAPNGSCLACLGHSAQDPAEYWVDYTVLWKREKWSGFSQKFRKWKKHL